MNIAYRFRIYPTEEQKILLGKTFGCCRFLYNQ
ncbi:helix-turn-helix domain-containing protein, partial [Blautia wexlerae]